VFVWVYYSAQIFLLGAEFTWIYSKTFGSMRAVRPEFDAKPGVSAPDLAAMCLESGGAMNVIRQDEPRAGR
jgi:hypothetical protein